MKETSVHTRVKLWQFGVVGLAFRILACIVGLFFLFLSAKAQEFDRLNQIIDQSTILNKHYFGFGLYDLDSNRLVYGKNEHQYFTPASNTKTYTLFTALKNIGDSILGLEYVVQGDSLIFWGTGDPTFLHPKLDNRRVFEFLKFSNKKLYYVPQDNPDGSYRSGWSVEDYKYDYQPDISIFPIYGNVVSFRVIGKVLQATPSYFDQSVKTKEVSSKSFFVVRKMHENVFEVSNSSNPVGYASKKPFIWSDSLFVKLLSDTLHREVGTLHEYLKPSEIKKLYSVPRNIVLREMMLPSDNFLAEHLTMVSAYGKFGDFLTDSLRSTMNKEFFSAFQDSIQLYDGSGLSTYNKITPSNMISLLQALQCDIDDMLQLRMFFAAGGVDGTLKRAYNIGKSGPFVWAKTGTLNGVYCQSGYLITDQGRRYAFSFLNNNFVASPSTVRRELVRVITYIKENY